MKSLRAFAEKLISFALLVCITLSMGACGSSQELGKSTYAYFLDEDGDSLESEKLNMQGLSGEEAISRVLDAVLAGPTSEKYTALLPKDTEALGYTFRDGLVTVDFSENYSSLTRPREVLARAGIVRMLMQIKEVNGVAFTVKGRPITNPKGDEIGVMTADTFIEDTGRQINNYQHTSINLYFATEDGKGLRKESRSIYYSASMPLEWAVVERLVAGPKGRGSYAVIPANTHIISVASSDGVCYVNLDEAFASKVLSVDDRVIIYAIVNSLIEDCHVNAVQISIAGETDIDFGSGIRLNQPFTEDRSLVVEQVEEKD
jgi:germination protein M